MWKNKVAETMLINFHKLTLYSLKSNPNISERLSCYITGNKTVSITRTCTMNPWLIYSNVYLMFWCFKWLNTYAMHAYYRSLPCFGTYKLMTHTKQYQKAMFIDRRRIWINLTQYPLSWSLNDTYFLTEYW